MPGPSAAQEAVEKFNALVKGRDQAASAAMVRAYAPVNASIRKASSELAMEFVEKGLPEWKMHRLARLNALGKQFSENVAAFADNAADLVTDAQRAAVGLAHQGAQATAMAGLPAGVTPQNLANLNLGWNEFPEDALEAFVGISADGAPVGQLFAGMGEEAAEKIKDTVNSGIVLGKSPRVIANQVTTAAGMPLSKSLVIARTETLRAYREATRLEYTNNSQVVKGYRRVATRDDVTCVACFALDGDLYQLNEPFDGHPNCRCAMVPEVLEYSDLGLDVEAAVRPENARDWLTRQSPTIQRKVLGNSRFTAWKEGAIQLNQLASRRVRPTWGASQYVAALQELGIAGRPSIGKSLLDMPVVTIKGQQAIDLDKSDSVYLRPTGPLKDPKTGEPVRGSMATPPDIESEVFNDLSFARTYLVNREEGLAADVRAENLAKIKAKWNPASPDYLGDDVVRQKILDVDPADFALMEKPWYIIDDIDYDWAPIRAEYQRLLKEQEAWARAVYATDEIDYTGLSILSAKNYNQALADVVVKNNWRPLTKVTTEHSGRIGHGTAFPNAMAAQYDDIIEINTRYARETVHEAVYKASNERYADLFSVAKEKGSEQQKRISKAKSFRTRKDNIFKEWQETAGKAYQLAEGAIPKDPEQAWRYRALSKTEARLKKKLVRLEAQIAEVEQQILRGHSDRWFPPVPTEYAGAYQTMVHELGHYGHRRYGMYGSTTSDVLGGKPRATTRSYGSEKVYDMRNDGVQDHASQLSAYACENEREYFAEAFVDYLFNDGANLTPDVRDFVEEVVEWNRLSGSIASPDNGRGVMDPQALPLYVAVGGKAISLKKLLQIVTPVRLSKAYDLKSLVPGVPIGDQGPVAEPEKQRQGVTE